MRPLTTPEQFQEAESAFREVFAKVDYTEPFNSRVASRLLLYPTDYTILDPGQFQAVAAASLRLGIQDAYLVGFSGKDADWGVTYGHRLVDLRNYEDYSSFEDASNLEHFLFAPTGEWGLVTSDGAYALIGGTETFVADIRDQLAYEPEETVRRFVSDWRDAEKEGASVEWVPTLLDHVFGVGEGSRQWSGSP